MKKQKSISILLIAISILLLATIFIPYSTATQDYSKYLKKHSEEMYSTEANMTNADAINISMFKFGKIYYKAAEISNSTNVKGVSISRLVMIILFSLFLIIALILAIRKKPLGVIIFDVFSIGIFSLLKWDMKATGALPRSGFDYGIVHTLYFIFVALAIVISIYYIVIRRIDKKTEVK